jgi:hypothetical protein
MFVVWYSLDGHKWERAPVAMAGSLQEAVRILATISGRYGLTTSFQIRPASAGEPR